MVKKKSKVNWAFIIVGVFFLFGSYRLYDALPDSGSSKTLTVELSNDIKNIKGRRGTKDFKFWTREYPNQFTILKGSISNDKRSYIARLKSGQKIEILISSSSFEKLGVNEGDITIQGISINKVPLMTKGEFNENRSKYNIRRSLVALFVGCMFFMNGTMNVPSKINYRIAGLFFCAILFMRIVRIVIY